MRTAVSAAAKIASDLVAVILFLCVTAVPAAAADIAAEARAFMERYAADLRKADRQAVAERYSRSGAYLLVKDQNVLLPFAVLMQRYAQDWTPPSHMAWQNLSYTPLGNDAVMVLGSLDWQKSGDSQVRRYAYTAVLVREDGGLRIRLEHECLVHRH